MSQTSLRSASVASVLAERIVEAFPADRVALGLEGGYLLDEARGMPAALRLDFSFT